MLSKKNRLGKSIPVIDLFAGPGGLSEGFSSVRDASGTNSFEIRVSIEKDPTAHQTLTLRAIFRCFPPGQAPDCYYDYIRGRITKSQFLSHPSIASALAKVKSEARLAELGATPASTTDGWIKDALSGDTNWVLIGGPPCQAYSLAGRARMSGTSRAVFEKDKRHFLYTEYLRIVKKFRPAVFVMENVKGILTSQHQGAPIFTKILEDLRNPARDLEYQIRSFVVPGDNVSPSDFIIRSEDFGIPQCRHRVILFGIRSDVAAESNELNRHPEKFILTPAKKKVSVASSLAGLPSIRSKITKSQDSHELWRRILRQTQDHLEIWGHPNKRAILRCMSSAWKHSKMHGRAAADLASDKLTYPSKMPASLAGWYLDKNLSAVLQHDSRGHMESDLQRYLFASCFALTEGRSPKLFDFPEQLLPAHHNITADEVPFTDRFKVQLADEPATTVTSHIAKDGHYYIHPDPSQCRSLTVREAARLQTFPDNYFFEGPGRTAQFHQIGNAVPPLLAKQIAEVTLSAIRSTKT